MPSKFARFVKCNTGWQEAPRYGKPLTEIARSEKTIVLKRPGYSTNVSGVRGMRDLRYQPATIEVYEITGTDLAKDLIDVELLIEYPASSRAPR